MKRARRFPQRLVRWTSLCVCFALVLTSFVLFPSQASIGKNTRSGKPSATSGVEGNGQERRVAPRPPRPGPPAGRLPNLDDMRRVTDQERRNGRRKVHAPDPVPSTGTTNRGQACDFCDFGFGSPRCGACARLFQLAGHPALTSDLAEGITMNSKSRALSVCI
jgi:hypothetical protein